MFAKARDEAGFSPYVPMLMALAAGGEPSMLQPMSMRLVAERPSKQVSFIADIDGFICVMQEVDTAKDPLAKVRVKRKICPDLDWKSRLFRKFQGIFSWPIPKLS
ncbi:hypothetical protein [Bradyrhizobium sp. Leo170]|uniref:hypothetical protein n=1 Tax=Bradyrhizobium sp. Leo170 TaxID=1571199 RepID=UPI0013EEC61F|nr:hypothetical protein [Bradyrhizobium sp. Leo170]